VLSGNVPGTVQAYCRACGGSTVSLADTCIGRSQVAVEGDMSAKRWVRKSAWLLWAATLVIAAVGLALLVWDWSTPVPRGSFGVRGFSGLWAVGFGSVGAVLTWRRPGHLVGWVFAAAGLVAAVQFASFEYALAALVGHRGLPAGEYVGWVQLWIWVPLVALITVYLFLLFPDGRPPGPSWRRLSWLAGGFVVVEVTGDALTRGTVASLPVVRNPFGISPAWVPLTAIGSGLVGLLGCAVLAAWSLFSRSRRGPAVERLQIKWLAYSGCLVALTLVSATIVSEILSLSAGIAGRVVEGAFMVAVLTMPVAVAVAVLKYRLYEIDRIISRTLAYTIVTGLLIGLYTGLVLLATQVLGLHGTVAVAAATLAAAALFSPLRRRVQQVVDRRFNRARYDADQTVAAFAGRLKDAVDLDSVCGDLAGVVNQSLEPAHVSVWISHRG
jgi:hypothetical protein